MKFLQRYKKKISLAYLMKKEVILGGCVLGLLVVLLSFTSASLFSSLFEKITGNVISSPSTSNFVYTALGASETQGAGASSSAKNYFSLLSNTLSLNYSSFSKFNLGIGAISSSRILSEEVPLAVSKNPDLITLFVGAADLDTGVSESTFSANVELIFSRLNATGAKIYVTKVPPLYDFPRYTNPKFGATNTQKVNVGAARVAAFNQIIISKAAKFKITVVDLGEEFKNYISSQDGIHPNDAGHNFIYQKFYAAISSTLSISAGKPIGKVGYSNCVGAYGYAYDPDSSYSNVRIDVMSGNIKLGSYTANKYLDSYAISFLGASQLSSSQRNTGFKIVWNRDLNQALARQYVFGKTTTISLYAVGINSVNQIVESERVLLGTLSLDKCLEDYYYSFQEYWGVADTLGMINSRVYPGPNIILNADSDSASINNNVKEVPTIYFVNGLKASIIDNNGGKEKVLSNVRSKVAKGAKYIIFDEPAGNAKLFDGGNIQKMVTALNYVRDTIKAESPYVKFGIVEPKEDLIKGYLNAGGRLDVVSGEDYFGDRSRIDYDVYWTELAPYSANYQLQQWVVGRDVGNSYLGKIQTTIYFDALGSHIQEGWVPDGFDSSPRWKTKYYSDLVSNMAFLFSNSCFGWNYSSVGNLQPGLINWFTGEYITDRRFICDNDGRFKRCSESDSVSLNLFSKYVSPKTIIGNYTCESSTGLWTRSDGGVPCVNMESKYSGSPGELGLRNIYGRDTASIRDNHFICSIDGRFKRCGTTNISNGNTFSTIAVLGTVIGDYKCNGTQWVLNSASSCVYNNTWTWQAPYTCKGAELQRSQTRNLIQGGSTCLKIEQRWITTADCGRFNYICNASKPGCSCNYGSWQNKSNYRCIYGMLQRNQTRANGGNSSCAVIQQWVNIINCSINGKTCNSNLGICVSSLSNPVYTWVNTTNWGVCNSSCLQSRTVVCKNSSSNSIVGVGNCSLITKINSTQFCLGGSCVNIACSSDSDCGNNYIGDEICLAGDVYRSNISVKCNNPGTSISSCSTTNLSILAKDCQKFCFKGTCQKYPLKFTTNNLTIAVFGNYSENNPSLILTNVTNFEKLENISIIESKLNEKNYVIIGNLTLGLNQTKTIYLKKANLSSNAICIMDSTNINISNCTTKLACPGSLGNYNCVIKDNTFIVSGLKNSLVMEDYLSFSNPFCGDTSCNNGETCSTCSNDCGSCGEIESREETFFCGDNLCNGEEVCSSCERDCGVCVISSEDNETETNEEKDNRIVVIIISVLIVFIAIILSIIYYVYSKKPEEKIAVNLLQEDSNNIKF